MEWPLTLDIVLGLTTLDHRRRARPRRRRSTATSSRSSATTIGIVAETIRDLAGRGVPVAEALADRRVALPARGTSRDAVRRGYEHLPRSQKRLPLV